MQALNPNPGARYAGILDAMRTITIREGYGRAWHGMPAVIAGAGPAHAMYFACYEKIKFILSNEKKQGTVFATGKGLCHWLLRAQSVPPMGEWPVTRL